MKKHCNKCNKTLNISAFYKSKSKKSGAISECKNCFKKRMGSRHQKHKDILVKELGGECLRCGYKICPRMLNFHHIDPITKEFGIAKRLSANLDILRKEVAKCILLCANCHGEKHMKLW